jgi:glycosyltransferase involved in cell wall biosynthesis
VERSPDDPHRLLDGLAAYLRRQLGEDGPEVLEVPLGSSLRKASVDAGVAVVAGRRSRLAEAVFAARSGMRPQWRGTARWEPGQPGVDFSVWDRWSVGKVGAPPPEFDVLAIVTTYNESDIIEQLLTRLTEGGVRVHVIDNWSTDETVDLVKPFCERGGVTLERFPADGPSQYFELAALLGRMNEVAHGSGADWVVHHDADEIHDSAWPGVSMRQGLWAVGQWGFNCLDHAGLQFRPIDESWQAKDDLDTSFEWFEFGDLPADFNLLKKWRPQTQRVVNSDTGGHFAEFEGRRIFPYKFPIRHYPLRSTAHARRKLFTERRPRWSPEERAKGWHVHYDTFDEGSSFIWDPAKLYRWSTVYQELLLQMVSLVGVWGNPRPDEAVGREKEVPAFMLPPFPQPLDEQSVAENTVAEETVAEQPVADRPGLQEADAEQA